MGAGPRPTQEAMDRSALNVRTLDNELRAILGGAFEGAELDKAIDRAKAARTNQEAGTMKDMTRNQTLELASKLAARVLLPSEAAAVRPGEVMPKAVRVGRAADLPAGMEPRPVEKPPTQEAIDRTAVNQRILEKELRAALKNELNVDVAFNKAFAERTDEEITSFRSMSSADVRALAVELARRYQDKKAKRIAGRLAAK